MPRRRVTSCKASADSVNLTGSPAEPKARHAKTRWDTFHR
ncbi:hypothetical protein BAL199_02014 [alpha proteobacterium BAL199]|nr:hypothetical protein BAL199_02014 [alpha proteobacterium BAL199]